MTVLNDLITNGNTTLATLNSLIDGTAAETLIPDPSVSYPFPAIAYDDSASSWTLTQSTADTADGLYKGLFTLNYNNLLHQA